MLAYETRRVDRSPDADHVRRCARCGAAALVCVRDWQHRILGFDTGTWTLDLECRACGAKVTLRPRQHIVAQRVLAFLLLPAVIPSVAFFANARRMARVWSDNPVVFGSVAPRRPSPNERVCAACRRTARCTAVHRREMQGISVGTRYAYRCTGCGRAFTIYDGRSVIYTAMIASVLSAFGALVVAIPPGAAVGAQASNRWFGVGFLILGTTAWVLCALQFRTRSIHPLA